MQSDQSPGASGSSSNRNSGYLPPLSPSSPTSDSFSSHTHIGWSPLTQDMSRGGRSTGSSDETARPYSPVTAGSRSTHALLGSPVDHQVCSFYCLLLSADF